MHVLVITNEWPTPDDPSRAPFVVRQVEFLRRAGIAVDVFAFGGRKNPLNYLRGWRRVRRLVSEGAYDLIHAQFGQSGLLALPKVLPLVVTFRGSDVLGYVGRNGRYGRGSAILRRASRLVAAQADGAILVADHLRRYLPGREYAVIPSGVDLERFYPMAQGEARARLGLPGNKRLVLFAASPGNPVKRYGLAKAAVELLPGELDAALVVASKVAYEQMPLYMNACDVLVVTSRHEGSPDVVKEALACNLPVVSVDVGDVRERVVAGCVVCEGDDAGAVAAGLAAVLRRGGRVEGRGAVMGLSEELLTGWVVGVYERVLGGR